MYNVSSINGNGTYIIDCRYNLVSNDDYISIVALNDVPSDIQRIGFKDVDTLSLCTNSLILTINCGNYEACHSDTLNYTNKAICCSSSGGCRYSSIALVVNLSNTSINDESKDMIGVYCDGYRSCEDDDGNETMIRQRLNRYSYSNFECFLWWC